jgi:protein O-mannosyl-transferase
MVDNKLVITEAGFLNEFLSRHTQRPDRPFCFILGAGASRASGIPTGGELAQAWLRELHALENLDGLSLADWATADRLGIEGFTLDEAANFYPQLYQRRYGEQEQDGYAFLESQMEGKEPSYGYSVLAYLLSETPHRIVITTNFDNLVADGLFYHSNRFPLVIGHDTLVQYATVELRRPLVAKIHGALGFAPKNQPNDISQLPEGWKNALGKIFDRYTPIVIGYGGNDGSLMGFLKALPAHVPDRVFWCVRVADARNVLKDVPPSVREYVESRRGRFVPIRGFDEMMAKLLTKLGEKGSVPDLYQRLQDRHRERERNYDEQQRRLFEAAVSSEQSVRSGGNLQSKSLDPSLAEAVSEIAETRKDKPWWVWALEAEKEKDVGKKERLYLHALELNPKSASLLLGYALLLQHERKDMDKAQEFYERAIENDPEYSLALQAYAGFLRTVRKNNSKAAKLEERERELRDHDPAIKIT